MRFKSLFFILISATHFFVFIIDSNIYSQEFQWAKSIGGEAIDQAEMIKVDQEENVYVVGFFMNTVDFDKGPMVYELTASGESDIFILKLDKLGNFIWARSMGGVKLDSPYSMDLDSDGNIYIVGEYADSVDFDPGPKAYFLKSTGNSDAFIVKLNKNGQFVWAKSWGGLFFDSASSICVDPSGNILIAGAFVSTVDFDSGPGVFNLISYGFSDGFITKIDPHGNFIWAKSLQGTSSFSSITSDLNENIFATGTYENKVDFDPGAGIFQIVSKGKTDIFILKLNSKGEYVWAKSIGGNLVDNGSDIIISPLGNIYCVGRFSQIVDFDPGNQNYELHANGIYDMYILKLSSLGEFIWVKQIGGYDFIDASSIKLDVHENLYVCGQFGSRVDFDPGPDNYYLTSTLSSSDNFILKLDINGKFNWASKFGGSDRDNALYIEITNDDFIYLVGSYKDRIVFDATAHFNSSSGSRDIYIIKIKDILTNSIDNTVKNVFPVIYSVPYSDLIKINLDYLHYTDVNIIISNINGQEIFQKKFYKSNWIEIPLNGSPGLYFINLKTKDNSYSKKIVKI